MPFGFGPRAVAPQAAQSATSGLQVLLPEYEGDKTLYKTTLSQVEPKVMNSTFNREEDNSRMEELLEYIRVVQHVPNVIYTFEAPVADGHLYIYDGAHRFKAARKLLVESQVDLPVLIAVRRLRAEEQADIVIKAEMHAINKRVIVPEPYTDPYANLQIKDLAATARRHIQTYYSKAISPANAPRIPNVNVNQLEDALFRRLKDMFTDEKEPMTEAQLADSHTQLAKWIDEINVEFKGVLGPNPTSDARHAAGKNCWLFALSPAPLEQFLAAVEAKIRAANA